VLWNVVHNAIKFSHRQGRVEIHVQQPPQMLQVTVKDNGQGISPSFPPIRFRTLQAAGRLIDPEAFGLGLGLSIAKHLVELHGGTISAHSAGEGEGATFVLRVPAAVPPISPAAAWYHAVGRRAAAGGGRAAETSRSRDSAQSLPAYNAGMAHHSESTSTAAAAAPPRAIHHRWAPDIPDEAMNSAVLRRYITADRVTIARFELSRAASSRATRTENEQVSCVLSGALQFDIEGRAVVVRAGEVIADSRQRPARRDGHRGGRRDRHHSAPSAGLASTRPTVTSVAAIRD
jgi:mannose-6-phosphate isomerase-like protein (cupin superfamily)